MLLGFRTWNVPWTGPLEFLQDSMVILEIVGVLLSQPADIMKRHFSQRRLVVQLDPLCCRAPYDGLSCMAAAVSRADMLTSAGGRTHSIDR